MTINVFEPSVGHDEAQAVNQALYSHWIGAGPRAEEFKAEWARHIKSHPAHLVTLHNCTAGLFAAVDLFIRPGDIVVVPAIHFIGAGNAIRKQGRRLILCDVNPLTLNIDRDKLKGKSISTAIILNHYGGIPCDVDNFKDGGFTIIEDAACAPASTYHGLACGTLGDVGLWSFDAMKVLTSGDGGMAWLNNAEDARLLCNATRLGLDETHGVHRDGADWWEYRVNEYGCLSEMNDVAAAIGLAQLRRLPQLLAWRRRVCEWYDEGLAGLDWLTLRPKCPADRTDSYYFYWVQCDRRDELALYLRQNGVYTTFKYWPLHWAYGLDGHYPGAERAARVTLLLPCHANLRETEVQQIVELVRRFQ